MGYREKIASARARRCSGITESDSRCGGTGEVATGGHSKHGGSKHHRSRTITRRGLPMAEFFVKRPSVAIVIAILMVIVGLAAMVQLPIA